MLQLSILSHCFGFCAYLKLFGLLTPCCGIPPHSCRPRPESPQPRNAPSSLQRVNTWFDKVGHVGSHRSPPRDQSAGHFSDVFVHVDVLHVSCAAAKVSFSAADNFNNKTPFGFFFPTQVPSWTILLTSRPLGSPPRCSSGRLTSLTTSCACFTSSRCSSASASSPAVASALPFFSSSSPCSLFTHSCVLRDPLYVPWAALHLLLSHTVECLSAVRGKSGPVTGPGDVHDHLHDPSDLLPP